MGTLPVIGLAAFLSMTSVATAAGLAPDLSCLSSGATTEAVTNRKVVAPGQAIVQARRAVPNAEVLRASLCRGPDALIYRITVLRHDGRLVRVTLDAPSGKIKAVR